VNGNQSGRGYAALRSSLDYAYRALPDEALEARLAAAGIEAEQLDEFFGTLAGIGRHIAQGVSQVAPHVGRVVSSPQFRQGLSGAASGAQAGLVAGPYGAAIGAGLGLLTSLAGSALGGGGQRRPRSRQQTPPGMRPQPTQPAGTAPAGPAAAQLLGMLLQPQVIQGLLSMSLGRAGARTVPIAGEDVPVAELASAVSTLASQAAAEHSDAWRDGYDDSDEEGAESDPLDTLDHILALLDAESSADWAPESSEMEYADDEAVPYSWPLEYENVYGS
jgi:hypothetical protein